ncbi:MAG: sugar transferase [Myxococcales bacterium]|nr:sugar transferase [Myxococcales bacterium]
MTSLRRHARAWLGLHIARPRVPRHVFPTGIELPARPVYEVVTRSYNLLGALLGVVLLSPVMAAIALAVKLTSPGPALYRGERVGRGEKTFHIFKFRTMAVGSEQRIGKRLVRQDEDHYTPIGRFLRKYRLDELAQLLNVLRGDMNLVGPRPMRPVFLAEHKASIPGYSRRFLVRPGITGQAQVRGGYYTRPRHKLFYDLLYIAHRSVLLDLKLIVLTFVRVMTRIFTTVVVLAWLLLMALVLPASWRDAFLVDVGGAGINLIYLVPTLFVIAKVMRQEATGRIYALKTPVDRALLGFILVTALIIPLSRFPLAATRGLVWYVCNGVVIFYLVLNGRLVTDRRGTFVATLVGMVALMSLGAIGELLLAMHDGAPFTRAAGSLGSPLLLAPVVVVTLPLAIGRIQQSTEVAWRLFYGVAALVLLAAAALTLSRSGILAMALALAVFFWPASRRRAVVALLAAAAIIAGLGLAGDERMSPSRAVTDLQAMASRQADRLALLTPKRMLVGVGARAMPNHLIGSGRDLGRQLENTPAMENAWLTLFVDQGPLGLLFFAAFLGGALLFMLRSTRVIEDVVAASDLRAVAAGVAGFAVLMCFSDALYSFPVMLVLWSMLGLGVGTALTHRPGPRAVYRIVHFRHHL